MPRGGKRPNAGKPKGLRNKINRAAEIKAALAEVPGGAESPLAFLTRVYTDSHRDWELRVKAAAHAAPFIHPRMPQAIHVVGEVKIDKVEVEIVGGAVKTEAGGG